MNEIRKIQEKNKFISEKELKKLSKKTGIALTNLYGTATFYSMFHTQKQGKYKIEVCNSPSCYLNGSIDLIKFLIKKLKIKSGETTKDGKFSLHIVSCIGCCNEPPAMLINKIPYTNLTKKKIEEVLKKCK